MSVVKIVVLGTGFSEEKEVSKISAQEVSKCLTTAGYFVETLNPAYFPDYSSLIKKIKDTKPKIVFNALHGGEGEDGRIQALFTLEKIPFTGSGHEACTIAMNKYFCSVLVDHLKIPTPPKQIVNNKTDLINACTAIGFPLVVKPNASGSSVGVFILQEESQLEDIIPKIFSITDQVLVEKYIDGRELTVTIIDGKAYPIVEIVPKNGWYDYTNKYTKGNTTYLCPAPLSTEEAATVSNYALLIYQSIGCKAYSRIDFRYNGDNFYFLEVNTLPGMTPLSLTPMAAQAGGLNFSALLETIIESSLKQ